MAGPVKGRYLVRFRRFTGTAYETLSRETTSLWDVVQVALTLAEEGAEVVSVVRVLTTYEQLSESERDTVEMLTGGRIKLQP